MMLKNAKNAWRVLPLLLALLLCGAALVLTTHAAAVPCVHCLESYNAQGLCPTPDCPGKYQPATWSDNGTPDGADDYYAIGNLGQLYWFASVINGTESASYTHLRYKLTTNIHLNPGYRFAFDADTGLVEVLHNGTGGLYIGTGLWGDASGENTQFDTTNSVGGKAYALVSGTYEMQDDAALSVLNAWTPIGTAENSFCGEFDGNGYTISGLFANTSLDVMGLFGYSQGSISNLRLADFYMNVVHADDETQVRALSAGSVVARVNAAAATVTNCHASGLFTVYGACHKFLVGGVVGETLGNVRSCMSQVTAFADNYTGTAGDLALGGVIGSTQAGVEQCANFGTLTLPADFVTVGGVVGRHALGSMQNCYNAGEIHVNGECVKVGGLLGSAKGTSVSNSHSVGQISAFGDETVSGGVAGARSDYATFSNCYYLDGTAVGAIEGVEHYGAAEVGFPSQYDSGEICYLLNGGQGQNTLWRQNLSNPAAYPVLDGNAPVVYRVTTSGCEANSYEYTFSNENVSIVTHTGGILTCTARTMCDRCGVSYGQAPTGHEGGTASCTEQAVCTKCVQPYGELLNHTYSGFCDVACNVCNTTREAPEQHKYGEITVTREPTKLKKGEQKMTCTVCGYLHVEEIPATTPIPVGAIVGISVGGVAIIGMAAFLLFRPRKPLGTGKGKRRKKKK